MDRNTGALAKALKELMSLSARRAWIEIKQTGANARGEKVALRKESVDRNGFGRASAVAKNKSLSARRAWIEIPAEWHSCILQLSLSARRAWIEIRLARISFSFFVKSLSARRAWIEIPSTSAICVHRQCRSPQGERG